MPYAMQRALFDAIKNNRLKMLKILSIANIYIHNSS